MILICTQHENNTMYKNIALKNLICRKNMAASVSILLYFYIENNDFFKSFSCFNWCS